MIDWRRNETDPYELLSACGQYRIKKDPTVYPVEYTPFYMAESVNTDGVIVKSWKRIEKPKHTADQAKEVCQRWKESNSAR